VIRKRRSFWSARALRYLAATGGLVVDGGRHRLVLASRRACKHKPRTDLLACIPNGGEHGDGEGSTGRSAGSLATEVSFADVLRYGL
jgi:hypothetical protein